jgi:hypothetical protein
MSRKNEENVFYNAKERQPRRSRGRVKKKAHYEKAHYYEKNDDESNYDEGSPLRRALISALALSSRARSLRLPRPIHRHTGSTLAHSTTGQHGVRPNLQAMLHSKPTTNHRVLFSDHCVPDGDDYVCKSGVYPRHQMPQVPFKNAKFQEHLQKEGMYLSPFTHQTNITSLSPMQTQMSGPKVRGIGEAIHKGSLNLKTIPILGYKSPGNKRIHVIDGHHRYAGAAHASDLMKFSPTNQAVKIIYGSKSPKQALNHIRGYSGSTFEGLR